LLPPLAVTRQVVPAWRASAVDSTHLAKTLLGWLQRVADLVAPRCLALGLVLALVLAMALVELARDPRLN